MSFCEELNRKFAGKLIATLAGEKNGYIEVTALNCTKGDAETAYAKASKVSLNDCAHFGDSMNDSTTVGVVKTVVAMGNSVPKFKEMADIVSSYPCKPSGLAKTLYELYLDN